MSLMLRMRCFESQIRAGSSCLFPGASARDTTSSRNVDQSEINQSEMIERSKREQRRLRYTNPFRLTSRTHFRVWSALNRLGAKELDGFRLEPLAPPGFSF